jgi:hypothetical protein
MVDQTPMISLLAMLVLFLSVVAAVGVCVAVAVLWARVAELRTRMTELEHTLRHLHEDRPRPFVSHGESPTAIRE